MKWSTFLLFAVLGLLNSADGQHSEGDSCRLKSGATGTCELYSSCKNELKGQRPSVCSYTPAEALICCPLKVVNRVTTSRISVQKCDEYKLETTSSVGIATLTLVPQKVSYTLPKCDYSVRLIVGGEITKLGEFPHMAAIGWPGSDNKYEFECGGSLISDFFVLTAAHCATNNDGDAPVVVRLGEQNLVKDDDGAHPEDFPISEFIRHSNYKPIDSKYNDIALIRLVRKVQFSKFIRPACLWPSYRFNVTKAIATGFGVTEFLGDKSNELLKVSLDIYSNNQCQQPYFGDKKLKDGIIDSQICSGVLEGGKDTCQGDSGGPLQVTLDGNQCAYYIVGITSFGKFCGGMNSPGVYTRVFSYLDWIESIVWK